MTAPRYGGKGFCRYSLFIIDERQRQRHLEESRVNMTRLKCATRGVGKGKEKGESRTWCRKEARGTRKVATKMSGLYREEFLGDGKPSTWAGEFRAGVVFELYPVTCRD